MCAMQRRNQYDRYQQPPRPQPPQPQDEQPEFRFRWELYLGIPLTVALFLWFASGMEIDFEFLEIPELFNVRLPERYVLLGCLGVVCVTALLIIKVFRKR